jgi:nucleoside 2-deoxyribosyltransferase
VIGLRICQDNRAAIEAADEIHIYWNPDSKGSLFDLGIAFALRKQIVLINTVKPTATKSFENVLLAWKTA